jgi:hypothetical protein
MFDRFDICNAYYMYAVLYGWDDYTDGIMCRLKKIGYEPSSSEEKLSGMSENARQILESLVEKREKTEGWLRPQDYT